MRSKSDQAVPEHFNQKKGERKWHIITLLVIKVLIRQAILKGIAFIG